MDHAAQLSQDFDQLGLPVEARDWLLDLWRAIQLLDDAADGDAIDPATVPDVVWALFVRMPLNDFYRRYAASLIPILSVQILKWDAANQAERAGNADERSYMWRAGYYDVVLAVCQMCGLTAAGPAVMAMYGETFTDYRGEFPCPTP